MLRFKSKRAHTRRVPNTVSAAIDVIIVMLSMVGAYWLRFIVFDGERSSSTPLEHVLWSVLMSPVYILLYSLFGMYDRRSTNETTKAIGRLTICNTLAMMLFVDIIFVFRMVNFSRWLIVIAWLLTNLLSYFKVIVIDAVRREGYRRGFDQLRVLVVGSGEAAKAYFQGNRLSQPGSRTVIGNVGAAPLTRRLPVLGNYRNLAHVLDDLVPDEIVIALDPGEYNQLEGILMGCEGSGIKIALLPTYYPYLSSRPFISQEAGLPLIRVNRIPLDNMGLAFLKRLVDIVGSLVLIVLTSPIMLAAAIGTRLSSPGPIVFRQERIGRGRRPFYIYKFRSMRVNSTSNTAWSTRDDPRRTCFGSFMRRYSIDELPQLFNVLKGDMSLVGPRPEIPRYVGSFKNSVPLYMVRHQVRPGMTGWAQVNGLRGDTSIDQRVEFDLFYIENWSLLFDFRILLMTPFKGIVNEQETIDKDEQHGHRRQNH